MQKGNSNTVRPHTVKKFELIENYVKQWAPKLLNYDRCDGVVFIDCMCNSGIYYDDTGKEVFGTPIRIARVLSDLMLKYPQKKAFLYFNDLSSEKIDILKEYLPTNTSNYHISTSNEDGNSFIKKIAMQDLGRVNYLLFYDPNNASLDWNALKLYFGKWGEIITNHMVCDSKRGLTQATRPPATSRYQKTYQYEDLNDILKHSSNLEHSSNQEVYMKRVREIIDTLLSETNKQYHVASFPFFNMRNALLYELIYCTRNIKGFRLFKKTAWKVFGGKSSIKNTHGREKQLCIPWENNGEVEIYSDEYCYHIEDIAKYLHDEFSGQGQVSLEDLWTKLDEHPVFPSEGFKQQIKNELKELYHHEVHKDYIVFG